MLCPVTEQFDRIPPYKHAHYQILIGEDDIWLSVKNTLWVYYPGSEVLTFTRTIRNPPRIVMPLGIKFIRIIVPISMLLEFLSHLTGSSNKCRVIQSKTWSLESLKKKKKNVLLAFSHPFHLRSHSARTSYLVTDVRFISF